MNNFDKKQLAKLLEEYGLNCDEYLLKAEIHNFLSTLYSELDDNKD